MHLFKKLATLAPFKVTKFYFVIDRRTQKRCTKKKVRELIEKT